MLEGVLFVLLGGARVLDQASQRLAQLHTDAPEKGADLSRRAPNASKLFNLSLRVSNRAWWMGREVGFEGGLVLIERTGLPSKVNCLRRSMPPS